MVQWILKNCIELIGVLTGLIYLYFSVRQKIWLWFFGIISSVCYVIVYFRAQLYADMGLSIYYVIISIYGWYHWLVKTENTNHNSIKISILTLKDWIVYLVFASILTISIALILIYIPRKIGFAPSSVPWFDAFLTAGSILATWMLARKILEQWLWWIVIDAISVIVFFYKGLYYTVPLYIINTIMAIIGYIKWKKDLKLQ